MGQMRRLPSIPLSASTKEGISQDLGQQVSEATSDYEKTIGNGFLSKQHQVCYKIGSLL